ncbi:RNA methyltransferase [Porphyromonas pogonae]|uniref:TrmH family RNA methyltransferase n=1 Tax=Porphyromonas pogonae TaxID=867595 RepID=UPI002E7707FF|nr:RNA methyltransferase [Porphyromonas pogonae]
MVTKSDIKWIKGLQTKKHDRLEQRLFVAEGPKLITEMICAYHCALLIGTSSTLQGFNKKAVERVEEVPDAFDFTRISSQKSPQPLLAVFRLPDQGETSELFPWRGVALFLDGVQDPGNMGTIIRTADWFGIRSIYVTPETADAYSPKVMQSAMGALARVGVFTIREADVFWQSIRDRNIPVLGTFLDGKNIYCDNFLNTPDHPILIVMGNEGNGITACVEQYVTRKITIPPFENKAHTESLNVSIACAIVLSEVRRHTLSQK